MLSRSVNSNEPASDRIFIPVPAVASIVAPATWCKLNGVSAVPILPEAEISKLPSSIVACALVRAMSPPVAISRVLPPTERTLPFILIPPADVTLSEPVSDPMNFTFTRLSALTS